MATLLSGIVGMHRIIALLIGWGMDKILGDPEGWSHPVVFFGRCITKGEKILNKGKHLIFKGGILAIFLTIMTFAGMWGILSGLNRLSPWLAIVMEIICIFFCLAGRTLAREVDMVFQATNRSLEEGRKQVSRIVGRDTSTLSEQEIRTAALETLSENLSDGVIAPLFWYVLLGVPGMFAYKMINTLDSMIGYTSSRYLYFGRIAARIDDVANYIPARLTALLMILASGRISLLKFVYRYGNQHASPNSGYPEAALAGILNCRFGGSHVYSGKLVEKPYIGDNNRLLTTNDMKYAIMINKRSEFLMILLSGIILYFAGN